MIVEYLAECDMQYGLTRHTVIIVGMKERSHDRRLGPRSPSHGPTTPQHRRLARARPVWVKRLDEFLQARALT